MMQIQTVRDIVDLWPSRAALAVDISTDEDSVPVDRIHKWPQQGGIPAQYHWRILQAARKRGFALTAEDIARVHDAEARRVA